MHSTAAIPTHTLDVRIVKVHNRAQVRLIKS